MDVGPVPLTLVSGNEDSEPVQMQLDRKEKMTYTEQAAKRKHCQRLTRYPVSTVQVSLSFNRTFAMDSILDSDTILIYTLFCSFIRLCDYLVVTMLHNLTVTSAAAVLKILHEQTAEDISVCDLVRDIPDDIEEQEKMLQVC